jgi:hypothetical protein
LVEDLHQHHLTDRLAAPQSIAGIEQRPHQRGGVDLALHQNSRPPLGNLLRGGLRRLVTRDDFEGGQVDLFVSRDP